jgi:two-component system, OmpR family, response regulator MprA
VRSIGRPGDLRYIVDMGSARVLLVEDDRGVRESLARALQFEGYEITTASDGGSGLELARSVQPDAVILDVMMPVLSGLDVARSLRAEGSAVPILMLTARHAVTDRVDGLDAGADDYLVKPFALDELLARLRALLRRSGPTDADGILRWATSNRPGWVGGCGATATRSN